MTNINLPVFIAIQSAVQQSTMGDPARQITSSPGEIIVCIVAGLTIVGIIIWAIRNL